MTDHTMNDWARHIGRAIAFVAVGIAVYGCVMYNHPVVGIFVGCIGFICAMMVGESG
jgi:hypothetical protein